MKHFKQILNSAKQKPTMIIFSRRFSESNFPYCIRYAELLMQSTTLLNSHFLNKKYEMSKEF